MSSKFKTIDETYLLNRLQPDYYFLKKELALSWKKRFTENKNTQSFIKLINHCEYDFERSY